MDRTGADKKVLQNLVSYTDVGIKAATKGWKGVMSYLYELSTA